MNMNRRPNHSCHCCSSPFYLRPGQFVEGKNFHCSFSCLKSCAARPKPARICTYEPCSREFIPTTRNQSKCSRTCANRARVGISYKTGRAKDKAYNAKTRRATLTELYGYKCAVCGISDWLGLPLTLQVDHINGVNDDNRIENLRLLCANCHSQTDTFGARNIKRKVACRAQTGLESQAIRKGEGSSPLLSA
jgi:5-methylcytosine-specific restriction endonuclease McrA